MEEVKDWDRYYNAEVDKMNALDAEYHLLLSARGVGKTEYHMQKVKEILQNGGHVLMATDKGFLEMQDALLMDSHETIGKMIAKDLDEKILAAVERGEMHIDLRKAADEIHQNAVRHGWWEEERSEAEVKALIHSEWSEALEEARAGRPLEWHECLNTKEPCMQKGCGDWWEGKCDLDELAKKPEGIAVELIDGVIRILDWLGKEPPADWDDFYMGVESAEELAEKSLPHFKGRKVAEVVNELHFYTAVAEMPEDYARVVGMVFVWIRAQGLEPEAILMRKHRYNTTRPYKHGKKF